MTPVAKIAAGGAAVVLGVAAVLLAAREKPPSAAEISAAYRAHLAGDAALPASDRLNYAWHGGTPILATPIRCEADGRDFHCLVRFAVESGGRRETRDRTLHLVRDGERWVVDGVEEPSAAPS